MLTGTVHGGSQAVVGATVQLWSSDLTAAVVGSSVLTDASGNFSVNFNCPAAGTLMYVTATGGNAGSGGANAHIALASALGACGTMPATVVLNELTSATAAYVFAGLAPAAGSTAVSFQGNATGLANAYSLFTKLAVASTGLLVTGPTGHESNQSAVQQRLDTIANAMAACDNSNNVSSTSAACAELFACAAPNATFTTPGAVCTGGTGTPTSDTLSAALAIAQNPGLVSPAGIQDVAAGSTAYAPALGAAPNDWSLPLTYPVKNFGPLAIDAFGNAWILSSNPLSGTTPFKLSVVELDSAGHVVSPATTGWTTGGVGNIDSSDVTNLAIDLLGNVWVSGSSRYAAEISASGVGIAPSANGWDLGSGGGISATAGVTIDPAGNAWFADGNAASVFEVSALHTTLSGSGGFASTVCDCNGIAADSLGNVWLVGIGSQPGVAKMNAAGVQGSRILPPNPYSGHFSFDAIAADASGNFWITDQPQHGIWQFNAAGSGSFATATPFANAAGSGTVPKGIAVDGAAHKWVSNQAGSPLASVTEFSATGAVNLSPTTGLGSGALLGAYSVAIDQSGNVWVADGGNNVTEFVGAAAPTKNPIASAVASGVFTP